MALTPAEKQRRYRERHKDRLTPAQEIAALKARVAELEAPPQRAAEPADHSIAVVDHDIIAEWERARGRKLGE
jgi:hypothetical protein